LRKIALILLSIYFVTSAKSQISYSDSAFLDAIFINQVYINTTEYITTAHGTDGYSESNPLYLGYIGTGISSTYLNGKIGACYFYTKGLNSTEITNNYNVTKSRFGL
jgi:hypothetical protein